MNRTRLEYMYVTDLVGTGEKMLHNGIFSFLHNVSLSNHSVFPKGAVNSFGIKFLAFVRFPNFVNETIMCQFLRQEIKRYKTFEVDKNIFIL